MRFYWPSLFNRTCAKAFGNSLALIQLDYGPVFLIPLFSSTELRAEHISANLSRLGERTTESNRFARNSFPGRQTALQLPWTHFHRNCLSYPLTKRSLRHLYMLLPPLLKTLLNVGLLLIVPPRGEISRHLLCSFFAHRPGYPLHLELVVFFCSYSHSGNRHSVTTRKL